MANCTDLTEQVTPDTASVSQSRILTGLVIKCDLLTCDRVPRISGMLTCSVHYPHIARAIYADVSARPSHAGPAGLPVFSGSTFTSETQP